MEYKKYVEEDLTQVRICEIRSSCKLENENITDDERMEEEEFSLVGVNPLYYICGICNDEDPLEHDEVKEHWEKYHKND